MSRKVAVLSIFLFLTTIQLGCQTTSRPTSGGSVEPSQKQNTQADGKLNDGVALGAESRRQSLLRCGTYSVSELILGVGLGIAVSHPLVWPVASLFVAGELVECFLFRQNDIPKVAQVQRLENRLEKKNRQQIRRAEQRLREEMLREAQHSQEKIAEARREVAKGARELGEVSKKEQEQIERLANKVLRDIYIEVELLKGTKFVIDEEIIEEVTRQVE
jgi:hypothetical protein